MKNLVMIMVVTVMVVGCRSSGAFRTPFQDVSSSELRAIRDAHYVLELVAIDGEHYQFVTCHRDDSQQAHNQAVGCANAFLTSGGHGLIIPRAAMEKNPKPEPVTSKNKKLTQEEVTKGVAVGSLIGFSGILLLRNPVAALTGALGVGGAFFVLNQTATPACAWGKRRYRSSSRRSSSSSYSSPRRTRTYRARPRTYTAPRRRTMGTGEKLFYGGLLYHHYYRSVTQDDDTPSHHQPSSWGGGGGSGHHHHHPTHHQPRGGSGKSVGAPSSTGGTPVKPASPVIGDDAQIRVVSPSTTTSGDGPTKPASPVLSDGAQTRVVSSSPSATPSPSDSQIPGVELADEDMDLGAVRVVAVGTEDSQNGQASQDLEVESSEVVGCVADAESLSDKVREFALPGLGAIKQGSQGAWKNMKAVIWGGDAEVLHEKWKYVVEQEGVLPEPIKARIPDVLPYLAQMIEDLGWSSQGTITHHCLPRSLGSEKETIPACRPLDSDWYTGGLSGYDKPTAP